MPTDLGPQFPPDFTGIPPHMSSGDFAIWQRYHAIFGNKYQSFYFDAAVGDGAEIPAGTAPKLAKTWTRLTQKRIDVIGIRKDAVWIIEVRDSAGTSALGSILSYVNLLKRDNPFSLPIRAAVLTDHSDRDMKAVMRDYGIQLLEV